MSIYTPPSPLSATMMSTNYGLLAFDPMRSFLARNLNSSQISNQLSTSNSSATPSPPITSNSTIDTSTTAAAALARQSVSILSLITSFTDSFFLFLSIRSIYQISPPIFERIFKAKFFTLFLAFFPLDFIKDNHKSIQEIFQKHFLFPIHTPVQILSLDFLYFPSL